MENLALCVSCGLVTRPREQNHHIFHSGGDLMIETVFFVSHVLNQGLMEYTLDMQLDNKEKW